MTGGATERRADVLRRHQDELVELIAEVSLLGGYWQGAAHMCGCSVCRDITAEAEAVR